MNEQFGIRITNKTIKESMAMKQNVVKSLRLKLCWEQEVLAKELGVSRVAVCNWETGKRKPKLCFIRKMRDLAEKHGIKFNMDEFTKGK